MLKSLESLEMARTSRWRKRRHKILRIWNDYMQKEVNWSKNNHLKITNARNKPKMKNKNTLAQNWNVTIHDATKLSKHTKISDPLHYEGPMTRSSTKKFKQALNLFVLHITRKMVDSTSSTSLELHDDEFKLINLISYSKIN